MTTKAQKIEALKVEYPTLRVGSDETGYTDLDQKEYEDTIAQWAENAIEKESKLELTIAEKLASVGLSVDDLKIALGLETEHLAEIPTLTE